MVIRNFNLKNLLKIGFVGMGMFAAQSFAYASPAQSQANPMPLVMSDHLLGLQRSAGTLIVDNLGLLSAHSSQVNIWAYNNSSCNGFVLITVEFPVDISWRPQTYKILARAVYANLLSGHPTSSAFAAVRSFDFGMSDAGTPTYDPEFPCFKATCSTTNSECTAANDATPQTVSLVAAT